MGRFKHDLLLLAVNFINGLTMAALFGLCWFGYYAHKIFTPFYFWGDWFVVALFGVIYLLLCDAYDAFEISIQRISETFYSQVLSLFVTDTILYCVTCLLERHAADPRPLLVTLLAQGLAAALWSLLASKWYFATFRPKRSAIVYNDQVNVDQLIERYGLEKKFQVVFVVDVDACLDDLSVLRGMETVFLSDVRSSDRNKILKYCVEQDIEVYMTPRIGDTIMNGARQVHMFHLPMLQVGRYHPSPLYFFVKRCFDVAASSAAMIVLSPLFLITAVAIKVSDGGPVFYMQERLTKNGKVFKIHKFRSMRVDAEKDGVARLSTGDHDDRITPVGRVIRKTRMDELPQLIDILKGDLSVVGPRPERPQIAAEYEETMPEFRLRLQAKAGLTGYAQVYGKYNTRPYDKLRMDLMYIAHPSIIEDLRICLATVKILFLPESTEGIAEGQSTAMEEPREEAADNEVKV